MARFDYGVDFARIDGMIAAGMVKGGRFTLSDSEQLIWDGSGMGR